MMNKIYRGTEKTFEKLASIAMAVLGNSITFILALCIVIYWIFNSTGENIHEKIGDAILGFTFLSLFIIQKSFNRFSASLHLKVNELVSSHEPASNAVINLTEKTEHEINKLTEEYHEKIK